VLELFLFENIVHLSILVLLVTLALYLKLLDNTYIVLMYLSCLTPFVFNGVLISPEYMPDQFNYLDSLMQFREGIVEQDTSSTVYYSSLFLSMVPVPFVSNVIAIGFINKLMFFLLVIFLVRKFQIPNAVGFFLILYPDMVMYTSLALRDTLIFINMVLGFCFIYKRMYLLGILVLSFLLLIKFQNFLIMLFLVIGYSVFLKQGDRVKLSSLFSFWVISVILFMLFASFVLDDINFYRRAMYFEDGGDPSGYRDLGGVVDIFHEGTSSAVRFMFSPYIWNATNAFQLVQATSNILIFLYLIVFTRKAYKYDKFLVLFWVSFIVFAFTLYGLVVSNDGTLSRYRFPFIALYVIAVGLGVRDSERNKQSSII
tara:strand:+ start:8765 stop:9874 length:1110 start_codon:yes stop_codon:yes gene_type:complete